jgi:ADP-ribose pyrophosphatase YjhB (NUDIX family)
MIQVFSQGKTIRLSNDSKEHSEKKNCLLANVSSAAELKLLYDELITKKELEEICFYNPDEPVLLQWFSAMFRVITAAGGLVLNKNAEVLVIRRHGKWDLPKGKVEKNEPLEMAAIREVEEECGVSGLTITRKLVTTYHTYFLEEKAVLKPTHWFLMSTGSVDRLVPQKEEGITDVKWMAVSELDEAMKDTYGSIAEVVRAFHRKDA